MHMYESILLIKYKLKFTVFSLQNRMPNMQKLKLMLKLEIII